jgi:hypothetical protein
MLTKKQQSRKSRARGTRNQNRNGQSGTLIHFTNPPPINPQIKHQQRMRYVVRPTAGAAGLANQQVTYAQILDGIIVATSAVTASKLFDQVKIKAVEIWAAGLTPQSGVVNTPATVSLTFNGDTVGSSGSARVFSDTSVSIQPAHIRCTPEKSQASQWQADGAGNAFIFSAPNGAIIDVEVQFRNDDSAPTASAAVVGATTGEIYYRGLDSVAIATTQLVPQAPLTR